MGKLHEILSVENKVHADWTSALAGEIAKMGRPDSYFRGITKTLSLLAEGQEARATEQAAQEISDVKTTVPKTILEAFALFVRTEDIKYQRSLTNCVAKADLEFRGQVILKDVPVDTLLGLYERLAKVEELVKAIPTLDASKSWELDPQKGDGIYRSREELTNKTEKQILPQVLYAATDKHPAQIEKISRDVVVGTFHVTHYSGCVTAGVKSDMMLAISDLRAELLKARSRANNMDIVQGPSIGSLLADVILAPLKKEALNNK